MLSCAAACTKHPSYVLLLEQMMYEWSLTQCESKCIASLWKSGTPEVYVKGKQNFLSTAVVYHLVFCLEKWRRCWSLVFLLTFWTSSRLFMQNRKKYINISQDYLTHSQPLLVCNFEWLNFDILQLRCKLISEKHGRNITWFWCLFKQIMWYLPQKTIQ